MLSITGFPRRFSAINKRALPSIKDELLLSSRHELNHRMSLSTAFVHRNALQQLPVRNKQTAWDSCFVNSSAPSFRSLHSSSVSPSVAETQAAECFEEEIDWLVGPRPQKWYTTDRTPNESSFPGRCDDGTLTSIALPNLATCTRTEVLDYLDNTWGLTDVLFSCFKGREAFVTPVHHNLRHPLVFYYGHPTSFFVNKLRLAGLLHEGVNPEYEQKFEVGVDEMRWDDNLEMKDADYWPNMEDLVAYRRTVYELVRDIVLTHAELEQGHDPINQNSQLWAVFMGLEHERIHLETSSVLIQETDLKLLQKPEFWPKYHPSAYIPKPELNGRDPVEGTDYPCTTWREVQGREVCIGKPVEYPTFGWDNEYGSKRTQVPSFKCTEQLITNGAFYEFVKEGGYVTEEYWTEEGWGWRQFRNAIWPTFWRSQGPTGLHEYKLRVLFDEIEMPWDWPAVVNLHEASAFCKWKEKKDKSSRRYVVGSEAVHHLLRDQDPPHTVEEMLEGDAILHCGETRMTEVQDISKRRNLNLSHSSPSPVMEFAPSSAGFYDTMGNVWEWCSDSFEPLKDFKIHPFYVDFSTPCFDNQHFKIMGGSFMSTGGNGGSRFSRYHFRPHFFQHAGFRVVCYDGDLSDEQVVPVRERERERDDDDDDDDGMPFSGLFKPLDGTKQLAEFISSSYNLHYHAKCSKKRGKIALVTDHRHSEIFPTYLKDTFDDILDGNNLRHETADVLYVESETLPDQSNLCDMLSPDGILVHATTDPSSADLGQTYASSMEKLEEINIPRLLREHERRAVVQVLRVSTYKAKKQ